MKTSSVVAAGFAAWASIAAAQINAPSDTMVVTGLPPTGVCSATIVEVAGAPEAAGVCGLGAFGFPDGVFTGTFSPTSLPFLPSAAVVLLEPVGEPIVPGEIPVFWPGTNRIVSDIVLRYTLNPLGFVFISDGQSSLASWVSLVATGSPVLLDETGLTQDLTAALGISPAVGVTVRVLSDVSPVPEPGTSALLLAGAGVITWATCRRTRG